MEDEESDKIRRLVADMEKFEDQQDSLYMQEIDGESQSAAHSTWVEFPFGPPTNDGKTVEELLGTIDINVIGEPSVAEGFQRPLSGADFPPVRAPLTAAQIWAEGKLKAHEVQFKGGEPIALLQAIRFCYFRRVPLPEWVGQGIIDGLMKVENFHTGSWDDAFGRPYPPNTRLPDLRRRSERACAVAYEVKKLRTSGVPIDEFIWERVADNLNATPTINKIYEGQISANEAKEIWKANSHVVQHVKNELKRLRRIYRKRDGLIGQ